MAMVCGKCKAYDPEGKVTTCPTCDLPMQFTLLPNNQSGAPIVLAADAALPGTRRPAGPGQGGQLMEMLGSLFSSRILVRLLLLPVLGSGGYLGMQTYEDYAGKKGKNANDPADLRAKFDDIQSKISNPQPIAGFQQGNNPLLAGPVGPPPQGNFKMPNTPVVPVPQPGSTPLAKRPGR